VIKGTGPGSEIWQTGFWTSAVTPPGTQAQLQTDCNAIAAFVTTWWTAIKVSIYSSYALTEVDMYQYVAPSTVASLQAQTVLTASPGTNATPGSPIDTCVVVSLRSAVPGRSNRGRMYLPYHSTAAVATGLFVNSNTDNYGTATKALMTSVAGYASYVPVVVSRTHSTWQPLAAIDTDNKPDVQRRRENRLLPSHTQVLAFP
jgi:hypothetical protein